MLHSIPKELIDQMVSGPMDAEAVNAASMAFKKALIERILSAELSHHLGYLPGADKPGEAGNHRNGASGKTVLTEEGRFGSTSRATARAASNPCSSPSTSGASPVLTTKSSPCTPAA